MREYLFRGKRTDNGAWVEGMPCSDLKGGVDAIQSNLGGGIFDIYPESFGQYTGIKDKNGRKIFEGDIVEGADFTPEDCGYGIIVFDDGAFEVSGRDIVGTFHSNYYGKEFEIVGNVFDNADLLEG